MKIIPIIMIPFLLLSTNISYAEFKPISISQTKNEVQEYYESGEHEVDLKIISQNIKTTLLNEANINNDNKKLSIIFDIDDTALNNYKSMKADGFSNTDKLWDRIQEQVDIPANKPMLEVNNYAQKLGYTVFFITARLDKYTNTTKQSLKNAGYNNYAGLYLITNKYVNMPFNEFKTDMRKNIEKSGYTIIANIGDQYSDLTGGHSKFVYKLPNYMYGSY